MKKKILVTLSIVTLFICSLTGCTEEIASNTVHKEANYSTEAMSQAFDTIGLPSISNFFERAQMKEIYELRDDPNLICYWYVKNDMTGKWIYQGKCVGYGIPYNASLTAPEVPDYNSYDDNAVIMQSEPNGIYNNGVTSSATWILAVDEKGKISPTYVESEITVGQTKMNSKLCESWSLTEDYEEMSEVAEIQGEVDTHVLDNANK